MRVTASTEVNSCLVGAGSLHREGEAAFLCSGGTVPIGDVPFVSVSNINGVVDQP